MDFSLGYIKSENQVLTRLFSSIDSGTSSKIVEFEDLKKESLHGLLYPNHLIEEDQMLVSLQEENRFVPIRGEKEAQISYQDFEKLNYENALKLFSKIQTGWLMHNNLLLLETLIPTSLHLKGLWPNDRTAFFEELWFLLKKNLAASEFKIIFNDLERAKKENEKNKLVKVIVQGTRNPDPIPGGELADKLMENYKSSLGPSFEVSDYDESKGRL